MPNKSETNELRLVGVSGTNKVMAGELSRLALRASLTGKLPEPRKDGLGSLVYPFEPAIALLAARYHRTSTRVLWDVYRSAAVRLEPLYADLVEQVGQDNRGWMHHRMSISVDARRMEDFAAGERQIVGTVKNAVIDGAARQGMTLIVDAKQPDALLDVRLREGVLTVSIDLGGRPMHQRGYRRDGGVAPLKENLGAAMVMLGRHQARTEPLVDPMAGSGTIAIEAAAMGCGSPVWIHPKSAKCESLAPFKTFSKSSAEPLFGDTRPLVFANELARDSAAACRDHVRRAGVEQFVRCSQGDFRNLDPQALIRECELRGMGSGGLILANPPYGERMGYSLSSAELLTLYRDFGDWCRRFRGWRAGILAGNPDFEGSFGGKPRIRKPLSNSPIRSMFLLYDL